MSNLWVRVASDAEEAARYPYGPKGPKIYTQEELDQQKAKNKPLQDRLWGSNNLDILFSGGSITPPPFPKADDRRRQRPAYDKNLVTDRLKEVLRTPEKDRSKLLGQIDPRDLWSNQPSVERGHMEYYMNNEDSKGSTSADNHNIGNKFPVVYKREDGQNIILSGHHRATRALLRGEPLKALIIEGPWGASRDPGKP
jgi:hypothetical protein